MTFVLDPSNPSPYSVPRKQIIDPSQGGGGDSVGGSASAPFTPPPQITSTTLPSMSISFGGYTPDYKALLEQDPGLIAARAGSAQSIAAASAARQAAIRQLAMRYGGLPSGFKDTFGDIDPETLKQAQSNQFSDTANLQRNYSQGVEQFKRALAARGVLQSGDLDYGLNQADIARGQQEYDLGDQFASAARGTDQTYQSNVDQANAATTAAIFAAEQAAYANPAYQPIAPTTAQFIGVNGNGPVYQDAAGNIYDQSGNPGQMPWSMDPAGSNTLGGLDQFKQPGKVTTRGNVL